MILQISFLGLAAQVQAAEIVSMAAGVVGGKIITSREVQIQRMLEQWLNDSPSYAGLKPLALDSKTFGESVQQTLLQAVVAVEAKNFNVVQVSEEEFNKSWAKLSSLPAAKSPWRALEPSNQELKDLLRRLLQAKRFIRFRAQSSILPITDAEALRYFNENRLKFGDLPFENFKENIKSYLSRTQVDRRLKDWFDVLLNKYQVKNLMTEI